MYYVPGKILFSSTDEIEVKNHENENEDDSTNQSIIRDELNRKLVAKNIYDSIVNKRLPTPFLLDGECPMCQPKPEPFDFELTYKWAI